MHQRYAKQPRRKASPLHAPSMPMEAAGVKQRKSGAILRLLSEDCRDARRDGGDGLAASAYGKGIC
jgi:hypothetical protein